MRLATDTGGTFTDLVVESDDGQIALFKASTVPSDPVKGVLDALALAAQAHGETLAAFLGRAEMFIHGTTHAINAIITGNTAKTALFVTEGHRDILTLREGGRAEPFNHADPYPKPYIPRALTFGVSERVMYDGQVHRPLDETAVVRAISALQAADVKAVAVCLLWSIVNPAHEIRVGELLAEHAPDIYVTLSHQLNPTPREYRRACSSAIDASLKPIMTRYVAGLKGRLADAGFTGRALVLTSRGGMLDADEVARTPVQVINSGPSVAPVAGRHYAMAEGASTAIVADTGGTTYDVGLIRGGDIPITRDMWIGKPVNGHLVGFPAVDMKSVGAGGGSIAWVDSGGLLHVGPQSAGAAPGPACYGRGGDRPTVTDAALVLGFIDPEFFLGGAIALERAAAEAAIWRDIAEPLGFTVERAAAAIIEVVTENMVQAIVDITVAQGVDPADAVLIGGGGAAGLNSLYIARRLGVTRLLVPETGATLSAAGALLSDLTAEYAEVAFASTRRPDWGNVDAALVRLRDKCRQFAEGPGAAAVGSTVSIIAEARYENQVWEIDVPIESTDFSTDAAIGRFRAAFDAQHKALFTVEDPNSAVEIVALRSTIRCRLTHRAVFRLAEPGGTIERGTRQVTFPGLGSMETPVRRLDALPEGQEFAGPTILESAFTTVVIDPAARYVRQPSGNLVVYPVTQTTETRFDGARLAIIANRFDGAARKMSNTLLRTGRSGVLNRAKDFSCCIVTAGCDLLMTAESLPIHVLSGPDMMARSMLRFHPTLQRGDAFIHNSPYHGCSHAADQTILVPVIDDDGVHRFTVLAKAHQADIGNSVPTTYMGDARDVYHEGALIFPAVQIQRDYADIEDILRMCEVRIRVPEQWRGDYLAALGAARIGERELLALGAEFGWETLENFAAAWFDYTENRMIAAIAKLPVGNAATTSTHDPFPGTSPEGVTIRSAITVDPAAGRITVDLTDNPDCLPNGLNLSEACARTSALIGVFNSIDHSVPKNAGAFRRVEVRLRENCVVGIPRHPTSTSAATTNIADRVANATQRAFAELAEGAGMAECGAVIPPAVGVVSGRDPRTGLDYVNQLFLGMTGGAAGPHGDAWLTIGHVGNAGLSCLDGVELDELYHPILVESRELVPDSEGAGRNIGAQSIRVLLRSYRCGFRARLCLGRPYQPADRRTRRFRRWPRRPASTKAERPGGTARRLRAGFGRGGRDDHLGGRWRRRLRPPDRSRSGQGRRCGP